MSLMVKRLFYSLQHTLHILHIHSTPIIFLCINFFLIFTHNIIISYTILNIKLNLIFIITINYCDYIFLVPIKVNLR